MWLMIEIILKVISNIYDRYDQGVINSIKSERSNNRILNAVGNNKNMVNLSNLTQIGHNKERHNNRNGYQCPKCGKRFKHKTNLKIHSKIHSSDAYICEFCEKRFARKTNLAQHLRVHTNEKPFKCSFCVKSFKQH